MSAVFTYVVHMRVGLLQSKALRAESALACGEMDHGRDLKKQWSETNRLAHKSLIAES